MKITTISVNAGRTLSMPGTTYANVRPQVTFTAEVSEGEDPFAAAKALQARAEAFMEDTCDQIVALAAARAQSREKARKREKATA